MTKFVTFPCLYNVWMHGYVPLRTSYISQLARLFVDIEILSASHS